MRATATNTVRIAFLFALASAAVRTRLSAEQTLSMRDWRDGGGLELDGNAGSITLTKAVLQVNPVDGSAAEDEFLLFYELDNSGSSPVTVTGVLPIIVPKSQFPRIGAAVSLTVRAGSGGATVLMSPFVLFWALAGVARGRREPCGCADAAAMGAVEGGSREGPGVHVCGGGVWQTAADTELEPCRSCGGGERQRPFAVGRLLRGPRDKRP